MASQMENQLLDTKAVDITCGECLFKANGYTVKFDGFTKLYEESKDNDEEEGGALPALEVGEKLKVKNLRATSTLLSRHRDIQRRALSKRLKKTA